MKQSFSLGKYMVIGLTVAFSALLSLPANAQSVELKWLEELNSEKPVGATWGVPLERGKMSANSGFLLEDVGGTKNAHDHLLWYDKPAENWNEALPVGNGFIGAMVFGGIEQEHLQFNENTLYSGEPSNVYKKVDITPTFDHVVKLLEEGQNAEVQEFLRQHWLGRLHQCYEPLGDLHLTFNPSGEVTEYKRELDVAEAIARTTFTQNGVKYTREVIASNPDKAILIRIRADKPGALHFAASLSSIHPTASQSTVDQSTICLYGQAPGYAERRSLDELERWGDRHKHPELFDADGNRIHHKQVLYGDEVGGLGMFFEARLQVLESDGTVTTDLEGLKIEGAKEVTLALVAATSFNGFEKSPSKEGADPTQKNAATLAALSGKSFSSVRSAHQADYKNLYDRVSLDLGDNSPHASLTTDQRVIRFKDEPDNALTALLFQYGRYLMISASRPGGQPTNLQGMWNDKTIPAWNCGYTLNINAEMNYWPSEITNLSECNEPFFRMIKELSISGRETAQNMYGIDRGWVAHHNASIWRETYPNDNHPGTAFWLMSPGWLSSHLWEHYLFTGNLDFLRHEAYPIMKGAAEFCADWLIRDKEDKYWITPVSSSPENAFYTEDNQFSFMTQGSTMDMTIIREVFQRVIDAAEILDIDADFRAELQSKLPDLLPFRIGAMGQLQEWMIDYRESGPQHRHISHLYGLYPGNQITAEHTPELFSAAKRSLEIRGDEATGWSMAWKVNTWARLQDGDHAYKIIQNLFSPVAFGPPKQQGEEEGGLYMNLMDACPPMQIDGNFGYTSGIAEMLMQSHAGFIQLLPALPSVWPEGKVRGLRTRGGFEIDLEWSGKELKKGTIESTLGGLCRIRTSVPIKIKGVSVTEISGRNPNPYFDLIDPGKPEITPGISVDTPLSATWYTIEFLTEKGAKYTFTAK